MIIILNMFNNYEIRNKLKYMIMNNVNFNNIFIKTIIDVLCKKKVFYNFL